jgi:hypothetical protein
MLPLPLPHLHASAAAVHAVVLGMEGANDVHVSAGICLAGRAPAVAERNSSVAHTQILLLVGWYDVHVCGSICLAGCGPANVYYKGSISNTKVCADKEPMMSMSVPASALLDVPLLTHHQRGT